MIMRLMAAFFSIFSSPFHKRKIDKKLEYLSTPHKKCWSLLPRYGVDWQKLCHTLTRQKCTLTSAMIQPRRLKFWKYTSMYCASVWTLIWERGEEARILLLRETFDIQSQTNKLCPCLELDTLAPTLVTTKLAWSKNASSNIDQSMPVLTLIKANQF